MQPSSTRHVLDVCTVDVAPGDRIELYDARGELWEVTDVQHTADGGLVVRLVCPHGCGEVLLNAEDVVRLHGRSAG